jgi:hypothetical protein
MIKNFILILLIGIISTIGVAQGEFYKEEQTKPSDTKKMKQDKIELVVVFKENIDLQNAQTIMDKTGINYRKGMDSSRGKGYFYSC